MSDGGAGYAGRAMASVHVPTVARARTFAAADVVGLAVITVLAGALRFATIDLQSFWIDEATTIGLLEDSFGGMLARLPETESTPPLYYVVSWVWAAAFGTGDVALRSLSALLGTAAVVMVYDAGTAWHSRRAGLFAALLLATSPLLVWYSQEARAYSLFVFFTAAGLALLARFDARWDALTLSGWAIVSAAMIATHYFGVFVFAAEAAYVLIRHRRRAAVAAVGGVAAVGVALLPLALAQSGDDRAIFIRELPLKVRLKETLAQFVGGEWLFPRASLVGAAGVALLAVALWRARDRRGLVPAGISSAAVLLPLAAVPILDVFYFRNLVGAWVPLALAAGVAFAGLRSARVGLSAVAAAAGFFLAGNLAVVTDPARHRHDWRQVAESLGRDSERITVVYPWWHREALALYRESAVLPPGGARARRIDLVGFELPPPDFRPRGFHLAAVEYVGGHGLVLQHYRADAPRRVDPSELAEIARHPQKRNGMLLDLP